MNHSKSSKRALIGALGLSFLVTTAAVIGLSTASGQASRRIVSIDACAQQQ